MGPLKRSIAALGSKNITLISYIILLMIASFPIAYCIEVSQQDVCQGDKVTITGIASPEESVKLNTSFQIKLPIEHGHYYFLIEGIRMPPGLSSVTITAKNVRDLTIGTKIGIWLTRYIEATNGVASISQANIPQGTYSGTIFGLAEDSASSVPIQVTINTTTKADSEGKYTLLIDTFGVPPGDYWVGWANENASIRIHACNELLDKSYDKN